MYIVICAIFYICFYFYTFYTFLQLQILIIEDDGVINQMN